VKVVPLHAGTNPPGRAQNWEHPSASGIADGEEPEESPGPEPSPASKTVRIRVRRRRKRVSPAVAMLARSLDGGAEREMLGAYGRSIARETPPESGEAAFWPVWLEHRGYLRNHSLRFSGGNVADAEDALSEAMIKAAQNFSSANIRNHRSWLLRLVHNACMDRHRSNRRQQRVAKDIMEADVRSAPAAVVQPDRSPEELLSAFEQIADLRRALKALPSFLAEPLMLYLDERSDSEIAINLNVTKEVVRKRRQIARSLLRQHILP
jgi:RNA polymerase sigma factor (sigma-70 family)